MASPFNTICVTPWGSPAGRLVIGSVGDELCLCDWGDECGIAATSFARITKTLNAEIRQRETDAVRSAISQLDEYFAGERTAFDIPLRLWGTPFQCDVWQQLMNIPYGEVCRYADIAAAIGRPSASRAAANAIGANPMSIIIPCHRVIGADGSLTGYAGGLAAKSALLRLESRVKKSKKEM